MSLKEFTLEFYNASKNGSVVVFTGAGMSTASGIRDFRGENGIYNDFASAEDMLTLTTFNNNPREFYDFYMKYMLVDENIKPNDAHYLIKEMQDDGLINAVITQNIDGLDLKAGINNVIELHGNADTFCCTKCHKEYSVSEVRNMENVPKCINCNSILKPNIILYEEELDFYKLMMAKDAVNNAMTLLVMGSSLVVNPAAQLVHNFLVDMKFNKNKKLFIVNKGKTAFDGFVKDDNNIEGNSFKKIIKYDGDIIEFAAEYQRLRKTK